MQTNRILNSLQVCLFTCLRRTVAEEKYLCSVQLVFCDIYYIYQNTNIVNAFFMMLGQRARTTMGQRWPNIVMLSGFTPF